MRAMKRRSLRRVVSAGTVALTAARVGVRRAALATKTRTDPELDPLLQMPSDVVHHYVEVADGGRVHVVERGSGRPLLLIHGVGLQSGIWAPLFHQLADRFRLLAIDVRGHGSSQAGSDGYGRDVAARDLAAVLEHFDLRDAVVAGHSMGGMILMQLIGSAPDLVADRVAGVVFVDTAAYRVVPGFALPLVNRVGPRVADRAERAGRAGRPLPSRKTPGSDLSWLTARMAFGTAPSAAAVALARQFTEETPREVATASFVDLCGHDARVALSGYTGLALILVGSLDTATPVWAARRIARLLPQARLEVIRGAGHLPMMERPSEVSRAIEEFVAGLPTRP